MIVQNVLKTDSLENIINGKFVFCKELKKGFIKGELSSLGLSDYSFENVATVIEGLTLEELETKGLNTVIFVDGEEKISQRMNLEITKFISEMDNPSEEIVNLFQSNKRLDRDYFDNSLIESIIAELSPYVPESAYGTYSLSSNLENEDGSSHGVSLIEEKIQQYTDGVLQFSGTDNLIFGEVDTSESFAISIWFNSPIDSTERCIWNLGWYGEGSYEMSLEVQNNGVSSYMAGWDSYSNVCNPYEANVWNHATISYNKEDSTITSYYNGVLSQTKPNIVLSGMRPLQVGEYASQSMKYNGKLSTMKVLAHSVNESEASALYQENPLELSSVVVPNSLIPILSSNTGSNGFAFGNPGMHSHYHIWNVFNNLTASGEDNLWQPATNFGKVGYVFNDLVNVSEYEVEGYASNSEFTPKDWTLEGSLNTTDGFDGDWTIIDTVVNNTNLNVITPIASSRFKGFRLNISSAIGGSEPVVGIFKLR